MKGTTFAELLRTHLQDRGLTYSEVIDRITAIYPAGISLDRFKQMVSRKRPFALPKKDRRDFNAFEAVLRGLEIDLMDALETFSDDEIMSSIYSARLPAIQERRVLRQSLAKHPSLREVIDSLPSQAAELLALPSLNSFSNATAFALIFALEREFAGLEMLIVREPPLIFFDDEDVGRWVHGMDLDSPDREVFRRHFADYRMYFRDLAVKGLKRYRVVLIMHTLLQFLEGKSRSRALKQIQDLIEFMKLPNFELILLDRDPEPAELEVISRHPEVPSDLSDTLSVVIRQTPVGKGKVEYLLIPMPQSAISLQTDRGMIEQMWALGVDQAILKARDLGLDASKVPIRTVTARLLERLALRFT
jgi:hypothetical protein